MKDHDIMLRDEKVLRACAESVSRVRDAHGKALQNMDGQLQRCSKVAVQTHFYMEALRNLLAAPRYRFNLLGLRLGYVPPTAAEFEAEFVRLQKATAEKVDSTALAAREKADAKADYKAQAPEAAAAAPAAAPAAAAPSGKVLGPDGLPAQPGKTLLVPEGTERGKGAEAQ